MQHMSADVMVNLVEDAVVPVNGRQTASEVAPLLCQTMKALLCCLYMFLCFEKNTKNTEFPKKNLKDTDYRFADDNSANMYDTAFTELVSPDNT